MTGLDRYVGLQETMKPIVMIGPPKGQGAERGHPWGPATTKGKELHVLFSQAVGILRCIQCDPCALCDCGPQGSTLCVCSTMPHLVFWTVLWLWLLTLCCGAKKKGGGPKPGPKPLPKPGPKPLSHLGDEPMPLHTLRDHPEWHGTCPQAPRPHPQDGQEPPHRWAVPFVQAGAVPKAGPNVLIPRLFPGVLDPHCPFHVPGPRTSAGLVLRLSPGPASNASPHVYPAPGLPEADDPLPPGMTLHLQFLADQGPSNMNYGRVVEGWLSRSEWRVLECNGNPKIWGIKYMNRTHILSLARWFAEVNRGQGHAKPPQPPLMFGGFCIWDRATLQRRCIQPHRFSFLPPCPPCESNICIRWRCGFHASLPPSHPPHLLLYVSPCSV